MLPWAFTGRLSCCLYFKPKVLRQKQQFKPMASWLSGLFSPPPVCEHNTAYSASNQQGFQPRFAALS